ncbi:MAG TPA: WecB/TagA/CpsF family glycosyltransferase [Bacteroidales bacterium]|nr:WecB/TagA/CpsF family glycosyltransferase [Bacteroidales bacterium]
MEAKKSVKILGYNIFTGSEEYFSDGYSGVISTLNPHSYIISRNDELFREALKASDVLLADGTGITMAVSVLAGMKISRTTGSDIHRILINYIGRSKGRCFYLGSGEITLTKIKERLAKEQPGITAGFLSPPFKPFFTEEENLSMIRTINDFKPEILFVGMTAPRQEKWVNNNRHLINARLICPIGAVFDFYAGTVKRPGKFWLNTGLEWLPRLLREPGRLWRRTLISTPLFLWIVLSERIKMIFR